MPVVAPAVRLRRVVNGVRSVGRAVIVPTAASVPALAVVWSALSDLSVSVIAIAPAPSVASMALVAPAGIVPASSVRVLTVGMLIAAALIASVPTAMTRIAVARPALALMVPAAVAAAVSAARPGPRARDVSVLAPPPSRSAVSIAVRCGVIAISPAPAAR